VVEIERHFLGKQIVTLSPTTPIKLMPLSMSRPTVSHYCFLIFSCYFVACHTVPTLHSMAEGPAHDPTPIIPPIDDDTGSDFGAESITVTTSSPTRGAALMVKGEIPELFEFFKKTSLTDEEHQAYHNHG
jgi:hypothetical protein